MKLWALVHSNAIGDLCLGPAGDMKESFASREKPVEVPRCPVGVKNEWARVTRLETETTRVQIGKGGFVGDGE